MLNGTVHYSYGIDFEVIVRIEVKNVLIPQQNKLSWIRKEIMHKCTLAIIEIYSSYVMTIYHMPVANLILKLNVFPSLCSSWFPLCRTKVSNFYNVQQE